MKKIVSVFLSLLFFFVPIQIQAQSTIRVTYPYGSSIETVPEKWQVHYIDNATGKAITDLYGQIHIGSKAVHCIQANVNAIDGASDYTSTSMDSMFSDNQCQMAGWIYALGIQKDASHEMDLACQILLWKLLDPSSSNFTYHDDIQSKINEVLNRIEIMKTNVEFETQDIVLTGYGKEHAVTLHDQAQVFSNYIETKNTGVHTQRNGNDLTIWMEQGDDTQATLSYDCFYSSNEAKPSVVYTSQYSQNVIALEKSIPNSISLNVSLSLGQIHVSKTDLNGNHLSNASFQLLNQSNEIIDQWISDESIHTISNLNLDETYTIIEEYAPEGYIKSQPVSFVLDEKSKDIVIQNGSVGIYKIDQFQNEVKEASFQVLDADGNIVDEWTSHQKIIDIPDSIQETLSKKESVSFNGIQCIVHDNGITCILEGNRYEIDEQGYETIHFISNLEENQSYILHEVKAPSNYVITKDIEFVADGLQNQIIECINLKTKVIGIQKLNEKKQWVKDAKLRLVDANGEIIDEWITSDEIHEVSCILGESYKLIEIETPKGYENSKEIEFEVDDKTDIITMIDQSIPTSQTGWNSHMGLYSLIVILSMIGIFILKKRSDH
ncbi:MSCRAMM family protein [Floccifex sp.]|uniref:MSCRAMM family protein n=1 Tax=Floccifex sp. TaxID=2815810 RepID=UPI003F0D8A80